MPFGTGLGRVFQKKGRSSSHPIGSCGRPVGVRTLICRVRSKRGAGVRRYRPRACENDAAKGHPQREYTDNVLNFQRKLHDLFRFRSKKCLFFVEMG